MPVLSLRLKLFNDGTGASRISELIVLQESDSMARSREDLDGW
jgi:hypothetical protein